MEFRDILKILRKKNNLTQTELAAALSIDQSVISEWENGEKYPKFENLLKLSDIFDISLDELVGKKANSELAHFYNIENMRHKGKLSLEDLRNEYNLTAEQFAELLGVSKNTLYNWEKKGLPNIEIYKKIIEHFSLTIESVIDLK